MEQKLIFEEWRKLKFSYNHYWQLPQTCTIEYEYKGKFGHPSSYAFVKFECQPAENLSYISRVSWTDYVSSDWVSLHENLICSAIIDGLFCVSTTPYLGCSFELIQIKYDEVSSSPDAFYKATKETMSQLVQMTGWKLLKKDS